MKKLSKQEEYNKIDKIAIGFMAFLFILCILAIVQHLKNG